MVTGLLAGGDELVEADHQHDHEHDEEKDGEKEGQGTESTGELVVQAALAQYFSRTGFEPGSSRAELAGGPGPARGRCREAARLI